MELIIELSTVPSYFNNSFSHFHAASVHNFLPRTALLQSKFMQNTSDSHTLQKIKIMAVIGKHNLDI